MKNIKRISTILAMMILAVGMKVHAAERDYELNVTKEYQSAKISITLPDSDHEYKISAISPKDSDLEYFAQDVDDLNKEIVINEPLDKGTWKIHVERVDEVPATETETETETEEPTTEAEPAEIAPIEGVSIKFEGSFEKILDVSKDITVASDIVGLKMYFKDDSFVAEWSDTTVGNVDIEVTNEKTAEALGKETVRDRYYELPLDESKVESIIVKIVPTNSAREEGAEKYFTYKFDNHPAAEVTYEDIKITNKDEIGVHINIKENNYKAMMMDNGKEVSITELLAPGEYDFTVPTEVGDNNYLVYIIDEAGNMRSTAGYVEKDVVAPLLQLEKEYVNITTQDESIEIAGKVEDYDYFTINDTEAKVEGDHTFKYVYELKEGLNNIEIVAKDEAGNISSYTATVTRIIPTEEPIPWLKIVIIVAIVGLAGIYIYEVIKKNRGGGGSGSRSSKRGEREEKSSAPINTKGVIYDLLGLIVPCLIVLIVFKFVIGLAVIQSGSMEPTMQVGDTHFFNRLYYKTGHTPKRGDIVVFNSKEYNEIFGKRIIGIPGDTIEFKNGFVIINGQYLDESAYLDPDIETNCSKTFNVPDGCYFMLGDNREYSDDSRYWNNPYISINDILGAHMGHIDFSFQYDIYNRLEAAKQAKQAQSAENAQ